MIPSVRDRTYGTQTLEETCSYQYVVPMGLKYSINLALKVEILRYVSVLKVQVL